MIRGRVPGNTRQSIEIEDGPGLPQSCLWLSPFHSPMSRNSESDKYLMNKLIFS
jgi:hypothetical protein